MCQKKWFGNHIVSFKAHSSPHFWSSSLEIRRGPAPCTEHETCTVWIRAGPFETIREVFHCSGCFWLMFSALQRAGWSSHEQHVTVQTLTGCSRPTTNSTCSQRLDQNWTINKSVISGQILWFLFEKSETVQPSFFPELEVTSSDVWFKRYPLQCDRSFNIKNINSSWNVDKNGTDMRSQSHWPLNFVHWNLMSSSWSPSGRLFQIWRNCSKVFFGWTGGLPEKHKNSGWNKSAETINWRNLTWLTKINFSVFQETLDKTKPL